MKQVRLAPAELDYLRNAEFLPRRLKARVDQWLHDGDGSGQIELDPPLAEEFRDSLTLKLAQTGFDADYRPNREGEILEQLIDRFL